MVRAFPLISISTKLARSHSAAVTHKQNIRGARLLPCDCQSPPKNSIYILIDDYDRILEILSELDFPGLIQASKPRDIHNIPARERRAARAQP